VINGNDYRVEILFESTTCEKKVLRDTERYYIQSIPCCVNKYLSFLKREKLGTVA